MLYGCFSINENPPEFVSRLKYETHSMRVASNDIEVLREYFKIFSKVGTVGYSVQNVSYKFEQDVVCYGIWYLTKLLFKPDHHNLPDVYNVSKTTFDKFDKTFQI